MVPCDLDLVKSLASSKATNKLKYIPDIHPVHLHDEVPGDDASNE